MSNNVNLDIDVWKSRGEYLGSEIEVLKKQGFKGIYIAGPKSSSVEKASTLPFIGFRLYSTADGTPIDFDRSAVITVVHIESQKVYAATVSLQRDEDEYDMPERPGKAASIASQFDFDAGDRIDLLWRSGHYLTTVLLLDQTSNTVETVVSRGPAAEADPAVVDFLSQYKGPALPPKAIFPPMILGELVHYPKYGSHVKNPIELPEPQGIALQALERVLICKAENQCILRGGFSIEIAKDGLLPPPSDESPGVGDVNAKAVIALSLVVIGQIDTGPFVIPLSIPVYDVAESAADKLLVRGDFEIDLFALAGMPKIPQTYFIHAFSGTLKSDAAAVSFVTESMLSDL